MSQIRLEAGRAGLLLWRNNVGVTPPVSGMRPVRYGLANDSARINKVIKSSDYIGIAPGGRFLAVEEKPHGWRYRGDEHERAQLAFIQAVQRAGGIGCFATSWEDVLHALNA